MTWLKLRLALVLALLPLAGGVSAIEGQRVVFMAVDAPESERLLIHGATDLAAMQPLILDFQKTAPGVAVEYADYVTNDLFREAMDACAAASPAADILLSSSVDQLVRLANDGCAQSHRSEETSNAPDWANWRDEIYGFTFEPVVFVYDKRMVPEADIPRSHEALADLLRRPSARYRGRIGTYDIAASGVGYLLAFNDSRQAPTVYGRLLESISRAEPLVRCCNSEVLAEITNGNVRIAYNVLGSYAYAAAKTNPNLGIVVPRDYALILARGAMIPSTARRADLGKRFLNYLLSARGRDVARQNSFFFSEEGGMPHGVDGPENLVGSGVGRPIRIGPALLAAQDEMQKQKFIANWMRLIKRDLHR
jgi:iron(III) transport system substrate-binding protein